MAFNCASWETGRGEERGKQPTNPIRESRQANGHSQSVAHAPIVNHARSASCAIRLDNPCQAISMKLAR
eukprot:349932-Chlamydomonas_euryale.AAC.11